jgi:hypothetical protein
VNPAAQISNQELEELKLLATFHVMFVKSIFKSKQRLEAELLRRSLQVHTEVKKPLRN